MSFWVSNDNTPVMTQNPRRELKLSDPDDPRRSQSDSVVNTHSDMFVALQPSSMEKDVSQLTVPFFEAQPVAPIPPTWLHGIQMYHKGRSGYGGFIAFRVYVYDLVRHIDDEMQLAKLL